MNLPQAKADSSLFAKIMQIVLDVLAIAAFCGYLLYILAKLIIRLVRKIANWLRNREESPVILNENGLVDEKQSLYGKNLRKLADRFMNRAKKPVRQGSALQQASRR